MFTGIIEELGKLESKRPEGDNVHFVFSSPFTHELKIDQSVAHNGVCLTVVHIDGAHYTVTAIDETLRRTNLGTLNIGDEVNLERCMPANGRFDGHIVQGHVDTTARCKEVIVGDGSWEYVFEYDSDQVTVEKGSITVNGVSLTVVQSGEGYFSVCIIPYTYEHTNFKSIQVGDLINLEFDIVGKYVARLLKQQGRIGKINQ
jgi:riboflavin synthase